MMNKYFKILGRFLTTFCLSFSLFNFTAQDGEKLFKMMLKSRKYLKYKPIWQYLVFNYNKYDLNKCRDIAKKNNIEFHVLESNRIKEFTYSDPKNEMGTIMNDIKFIKSEYGKIKDWKYIND